MNEFDSYEDNRSIRWLPKAKITPFITLYKRICTHFDSVKLAQQHIGVSATLCESMVNGSATARTGKMVLEAYNKIKDK